MFHAFIRSGKMAMAPSTAELFTSWKNRNEGVEVVIEKWEPTRSMRQHRFYWVYMEMIARESGEAATSLHEYFKRKFLKPEVHRVKGETFETVPSTTTLSKKDFSEYLERIVVETGIAPPDPIAVGYIDEHQPRKNTVEVPKMSEEITQF